MVKTRLLLILGFVVLPPVAVFLAGRWHVSADAAQNGGVNQGLMMWWIVGGVGALCWSALAAWVIERRILGERKSRSFLWER